MSNKIKAKVVYDESVSEQLTRTINNAIDDGYEVDSIRLGETAIIKLQNDGLIVHHTYQGFKIHYIQGESWQTENQSSIVLTNYSERPVRPYEEVLSIKAINDPVKMIKSLIKESQTTLHIKKIYVPYTVYRKVIDSDQIDIGFSIYSDVPEQNHCSIRINGTHFSLSVDNNISE